MGSGDTLERISSALESIQEMELGLVIIELKNGDEINTMEQTLKDGHIVLLKIVTADQSIIRRAIERANGAIRNAGGEIFSLSGTPYIIITPGAYVRVVKK
ncbi:MAG: cell division protein SepF [Candidatus Korarchaeota archaeon]